MPAEDNWREQVYVKLAETFDQDAESFVRVQFYLDKEEAHYQDSDEIPPSLRTLKRSLSSDPMFRAYAKRLADDTRTAENDPVFRRIMDVLWTRIMEASDEAFDDSAHQCFDLVRLTDSNKLQTNFSFGLARAWAVIPEMSRQQIMSVLPKLIKNRALMGSFDEVVSLFNKTGGTVVMVGLAALTLGYDVILNIGRWWRGEITGKRCAKNVIDSVVSISAGVGGGMLGTGLGVAIGSALGPVGWITLIGGVAGGIAVGQLANLLVDRLTQWLFDIPQLESLENAYNYLGVTASASNHEINTAFRRLCLKHHPDRGGNHEDFVFLECNMAVIKTARGE